MKKIMIASFLSILTLLLMNCATTGITPAENIDPSSIEVVYKKMIQGSGQGVIASPALSPDHSKKLSVSMGGGKLYIENLDGSEKEVAFLPKNDPAFDEMENLDEATTEVIPENVDTAHAYIKKVYEKDPRKGAALAAMVAFSNMTEKLGEDIRHFIDISWSPDDSQVVFLVYAPISYKAIYFLMDAETFKTKPLKKFYPPVLAGSAEHQSDDVVYNCGASWKSDDTVVLSTFMGAEGAEYYNLVEVNINTGEEKIINENDVIQAYFSPDGKKAAFFRPGGEYEGKWYSTKSSLESYFKTLDLYVGDADFSNAEKIADGIIINRRVAWSEDGRYLAYVQDGKRTLTGAKNTLKILDTKTNESFEICTGTFLNSPRFYPGNEIYFFVGDNIYKTKI